MASGYCRTYIEIYKGVIYMAKTVSIEEVKQKVKFLNQFMYENFIFDFQEAGSSEDLFVIFKDWGCKGSDCVKVGGLKDCNTYLNTYIRKHDLKEVWKDYKNNI
jgi:hypothetical protein